MISEPMTMATDYLLGVFTLVLGLRLWRERGSRRGTGLWGMAFFASAVAALSGGTYHGFVRLLEPAAAAGLWKTTLYAVGVASFSLLAAAAFQALAGAARNVLLVAAGSKFLLYALWMAGHDEFRYVIYDYAPALLIVLLLQGWLWLRRRTGGSLWICAGILVSFAAAAVQAARLAPHPHFNHNDLYHVIQMGAFYLLYRGGMLLKDRDARTEKI